MRKITVKLSYWKEPREGFFHSVSSDNYHLAVIFSREGKCPEMGFFSKSEVIFIEVYMRKMTYQQAATCGENLKVRVTPEQSEKMQLAWFAAGKTWADDLTEVSDTDKSYLFLNVVYGLDCCGKESRFFNSEKEKFLDSDFEEIELIDDLPQHDFASQQEVLLWVAQGNKIKNIKTNSIIGFKDGKMHNFTGNCDANTLFLNFENWKKHTPPRLIRVNGVEVPAPLDSLKGVESYWTPAIHAVFGNEKATKINKLSDWSDSDYAFLKDGLCYATKEVAIKRAEAMVKFEVVE